MTLAPRLTVSKRHYCTFSQLWTQWLQLVALSAIASSLAVGAATAQSPAQPSDNNIEDASPTEATSATQRPTARPTLRLNSEGEPVAELQALLKLLGLYSGAVDGVYNEATQAAVIGFQQAASLSADGIVGPATWNRLLPSPPSVENPPDSAAATAGPENSAAIAAEAMPPNQATPVSTAPAVEASVSETPESSAVSEPSPVATASGAPSTPATSTISSAAPVELPILRRGMYGPAVARLQQRLQGLGFYNGAIDGIFGPGTEQAVQQAQQQYRLSPDGIVGSATWSALLR